jgi:glutamyl-tRNA reductase
VEKGHSFFNIGINYKKADTTLRSKFSVSEDNARRLLLEAKSKGFYLFVVSTCNRTEIFGNCSYATDLIQLLCKYSQGSEVEFLTNSYVLDGDEAILHLFRLGTGLESQILGDFEIIGQLKRSFNFAKELGATNAYLERMINDVIRTSKEVKNTTEFSSKAASVSYAAVQWIRQSYSDHSKYKNVQNIAITLLGTGEIGKITCANLVKHFPNNCITLINRTKETAEQISKKFEVQIEPIEKLEAVLETTDVLIVATNAPNPTVTNKIVGNNKLAIIDLSIPSNAAVDKEGVQVVTLDDLTSMVDDAIETRKSEIPKVEEIIQRRMDEFDEWCQSRKHKDSVQAFKKMLQEIQKEELEFHAKKVEGANLEHAQIISDNIIQKVTKQFVIHLKNSSSNSHESVKVINEIFNLEI